MVQKLLLLKINPAIAQALESDTSLSPEVTTKVMATADDAILEVQRRDAGASVIVLGTTLTDPIQTMQRLHTVNSEMSVVLLCEKSKISDLKKSIQFTPFISRSVYCVAADDTFNVLKQIHQTLERAKLRDNYLHLITNANVALTQAEHSDKRQAEKAKQIFFDRLLESAPIGIASVDVEGLVLSWNNGAMEISGQTELKIIGKKFASLFQNIETQRSLNLQFKRAHSPIAFRSTPVVFERQLDSGEQYLEIVVASITGREDFRGSVVLFQDVTDRVLANLERQKREVILEEAVRSRDDFLSVASHELKTPLTPLKLQLQKLSLLISRGKIEEVTPERIKKIVDVSDKQITRLTALIEDLLDVARISSGKLKLNREPCDIVQLCTDIVETHREQAAALGVSFKTNFPHSLICNVDRLRIEQVVTNLISNAIKYGQSKPVTISIQLEVTAAHILVADSGIGISEVDQKRIFSRFEQVKSASSVGGLGLGLYISKQIVEAHGGSISVLSEGSGGSTFDVSVPNDHA